MNPIVAGSLPLPDSPSDQGNGPSPPRKRHIFVQKDVEIVVVVVVVVVIIERDSETKMTYVVVRFLLGCDSRGRMEMPCCLTLQECSNRVSESKQVPLQLPAFFGRGWAVTVLSYIRV